MKHHDFNQGFTLFEMAIVLAIVGLITGGIVVLNSYVKHAQLTTGVEEARYFMNAFGQFQNTYGAVPGDMAVASGQWSDADDGDGNGYVHAITDNTDEYFYAFQHLAKAKMITGSYTGAPGSGGASQAVIGDNIPRSVIEQVGYYFDHPESENGDVAGGDAFYFAGKYFHVLIMAGMQAADTAMPTRNFISPKDAYEIDAKFDDGLPGRGWITTPENTTSAGCADSDTPATAVYTVTSNAKACTFVLKMQ